MSVVTMIPNFIFVIILKIEEYEIIVMQLIPNQILVPVYHSKIHSVQQPSIMQMFWENCSMWEIYINNQMRSHYL